jgi:hypothetical protein
MAHTTTNPALTSTPQSAVVLLEPTDRQQLDIERTELLALPLPSEIASPREYEELAEQLKRVDGFVKRAKPSFDKVCASAYQTWKDACNLRGMFFERLDAFTTGARRLLGDYQAKQDRIRREEEQRIREEEQRRLEEQRRAEASLLAKQGQKEMAAVVRATPVVAPPVVLPSAVPQVAGLTYRDEWDMVPIGGDTPDAWTRAMAMLVKPEYLQFVQANRTGMRAFARQTKGSIKVPGFEFVNRKVAVRR